MATPVFGGMLAASLIGVFAIPPLYVLFQGLRERIKSKYHIGTVSHGEAGEVAPHEEVDAEKEARVSALKKGKPS